MTRSRLAIVVVANAIVVGLLIALLLVAVHGPPIVGKGYVLTTDLGAGTAITSSDYSSISLTYATSDFDYLTSPPNNAVSAHPLHKGTLLGNDDILPASAANSLVAITVTNPPPLTPGQSLINVYLSSNGTLEQIGAHMPVVSTGPLTIQVPAKDAEAWLVIANSKVQLLATSTTDTASQGAGTISLCAAQTQLTGQACTVGGP